MHETNTQIVLQVATDAILKTTFNFCLDNLPVKQKSVDSSQIIQLFQNVNCVEPNLADQELGKNLLSLFDIVVNLLEVFKWAAKAEEHSTITMLENPSLSEMPKFGPPKSRKRRNPDVF